MQLDRLLTSAKVVETRGDLGSTEVTSIVLDSRQAVPGSLFCCLPGRRHDGHDFAPDAISKGASALLVERIVPVDVPQARVEPGTIRGAMATAAAELHGHPSRDLRVIGVTGTNGKTTVAYMLRSVLERCGLATAVFGTIGGPLTTMESPALQAKLAAHRDAGGEAVAMEVSSHALDQCRVEGIHFASVVFTNLSQDHLDYHGTMENYFESKARLFAAERAETGVVNADDPWGRRLLGRGGLCMRGYSLREVGELEVGVGNCRFEWRGQRVELRLGGRFNVSNALAAMTVASQMGMRPHRIAEGVSAVEVVPGRMEPVATGQPFNVVVDYAHTPAGLEAVLTAARQSSRPGSGVIVVFGCGGDRDKAKRPLMGEVASRLADLAVVTSDNPRSEDPDTIIAEVLAGIPRDRAAVVEPDRRSAIGLALERARDGDTVIIAGKGHETTQELADGPIDLDDREMARAWLESTGGSRS